MSDLFQIGVSALQTFSRQLQTTSHNISNVQTPGYSRQQAELHPLLIDGVTGSGVSLGAIRRVHDQFVTGQLRDSASARAAERTYGETLGRLESLFSETGTGLDHAMNGFFDALYDLSNQPVSGTARQLVLAEGEELVGRFAFLSEQLAAEQRLLDQQVQAVTTRINTLSKGIADINGQLVLAQGRGVEAADLRDERDRKLLELSELTGIRITEQGDGGISVFTGSGQALVLGQRSFELGTQVSSAQLGGGLEITYEGVSVVTGQIEGGTLGGLLRAATEGLQPKISELGRIGLALVETVNQVHAQGMDLDGLLGSDFFGRPDIQARAATGNLGNLSLSVQVADPGALLASDYQIRINASSELEITRLSDGTVSNFGAGGGPFALDGLQFNLDSGSAVPGDIYRVQPGQDMAAGLTVLLGDPARIAAASPVAGSAVPGNGGDAALGPVVVTDSGNPAFSAVSGALTPPIAVRFLDSSSYEILDNSNPAAPITLEGPIPYSPGSDLFPSPGGIDFGYQTQISGAPQGGDQFEINYNSGATGDNRNALALAGLRSERFLDNDRNSLISAYQGMTSDVAARTSAAKTNETVFSALFSQAENQRAAISGVNLDEEAANLLRFQQAYEAAAQVIRVAGSLFDTLIETVGRR